MLECVVLSANVLEILQKYCYIRRLHWEEPELPGCGLFKHLTILTVSSSAWKAG